MLLDNYEFRQNDRQSRKAGTEREGQTDRQRGRQSRKAGTEREGQTDRQTDRQRGRPVSYTHLTLPTNVQV